MPTGSSAVRLSALLGRGTSAANLGLVRRVRAGAGCRSPEIAIVLTDACVVSSQTGMVSSEARATETIVLDDNRIRGQH